MVDLKPLPIIILRFFAVWACLTSVCTLFKQWLTIFPPTYVIITVPTLRRKRPRRMSEIVRTFASFCSNSIKLWSPSHHCRSSWRSLNGGAMVKLARHFLVEKTLLIHRNSGWTSGFVKDEFTIATHAFYSIMISVCLPVNKTLYRIFIYYCQFITLYSESLKTCETRIMANQV